MNKTLSIGLAGFSFMIEEHAYIKLSDYLSALRASLDASEADEVMHDIEIRMVEIFKDALGKREVINDADVEKMIAQIGKPEQIEEQEETYYSNKTASAKTFATGTQKQLFRDPENAKLGGVCAGLANYFGLEISVMRAIWLGISFLGIFTAHISTLLIMAIYGILWIVLPKAQSAADFLKMKGKPLNFDNLKEESSKIVQFANESSQKVGDMYNESKPFVRQTGNGLWNVIRFVLGGFLALIGITFLVGSFAALGAGWIDSTKIHLPGNIQFYLQEGNLQYILIAFAFLTLFIPALLCLFLTIKLFSPKTTFNHIGYVFGALALIWLGLAATIIGNTLKYKSQYSGQNEQSENVSINTTSDSILVDLKKVAIPANFRAYGRDFFTDKKLVYQQEYPNLDVTRKDGDFQPYLIVKKYAEGYNKPLNIDLPLEVSGNKVLLPNYIGFPFNEKLRDYHVNYELVVPKGKKVIGLNDENGFSINDEEEDDNSSNATADSASTDKTVVINPDKNTVTVNGKKVTEAEADRMMKEADKKDFKEISVNVSNGKKEIIIKTK